MHIKIAYDDNGMWAFISFVLCTLIKHAVQTNESACYIDTVI